MCKCLRAKVGKKYTRYAKICKVYPHYWNALFIYFLFIFHFFGCVYKKKKKERKNYIYIKIHNILIIICESIFSLSLFFTFQSSCDTTHKRAHEKKTSVAEEQRGSKMIVKGARESIRVASAV